MKRFTAAEKWEKSWFQDSTPKMKLLWLYLMDKADACGVWEINLRLASFQIGEDITTEDLKTFGDRLELLKDNKLWIRSFCGFQYGHLSDKSPPHKNVLKLLTKHNLLNRKEIILANGNDTPTLPLDNPSVGLQDKDKEKDKDKGKEKDDSLAKAKDIIDHLNAVTGSDYGCPTSVTKLIRLRLGGKGVTAAGVKEMIDSKAKEWLGSDMEKYLRPGTLFRDSNFNNYYGARKIKKKSGSVDATGRKVTRFK